MPLLLGLLAGIYLLWRFGAAFVISDRCPRGHGWWDYFHEATSMVHELPLTMTSWRNLLYPTLLGVIGERIGYVETSVLLSSLATLAIVLSAGLGGRALGGPWAGGLAALAVPFSRLTATASRWSNFYPLLAGATALVVGSSACLARWPHPILAFLTGLAMLLAGAVDVRGLLLLPIALGAVTFATLQARGRARWLLIPAFLLALSPALALWTSSSQQRVPLSEQLYEQRAVGHRWVMLSNDRALMAACRDTPLKEMPSLTNLTGPCARALVRFSLERELPRDEPFPVPWLLLALPLVLLPGKRGWKGTVSSVICLWGSLGLLLLQMLWLPVQDRYVLQFAAPLALLVPVALHRVGEHLTLLLERLRSPVLRKGAQLLPALVLLGPLLFLLGGGTPERAQPTYDESDENHLLTCRALGLMRARLGPDDTFMDCTELYVGLALLPDTYGAPDRERPVYREEQCRAWMEPGLRAGRTYMATEANGSPQALGISGWERVEALETKWEGFQLWLWEGEARP